MIPRIKAVCRKCRDYSRDSFLHCGLTYSIDKRKCAVWWNGYRSEVTPVCPYYMEHSIVARPKQPINPKTIAYWRRFDAPPRCKDYKGISDGKFWRIIESCNWQAVEKFGDLEFMYVSSGKIVEDYHKQVNALEKSIKAQLSKKYCRTVLKAVKNMLVHKSLYLRRVWFQWERDNNKQFRCGDDSFGDLAYHIIGLGRKSYLKNLYNPELAWERSHKGRYTECFLYCFPDVDHHTRLAKFLLKQKQKKKVK